MNYVLDFRANDVGGAVVPGVILNGPGLGSEVQLRAESAVTFLVHGFNVDRPSGRDVLTRLATNLAAAKQGAYVAVLWPGDRWTRAVSYSFEGRNADDSASALARYIGDVIARGSVLSFVSHSLGARVVMETVKLLQKDAYPVRQVCLLAAAIDDFSVASAADYLGAVVKTDRVAVLASKNDAVLRYAYPAGDLLQAFLFFSARYGGTCARLPRSEKQRHDRRSCAGLSRTDSRRPERRPPGLPALQPSQRRAALSRDVRRRCHQWHAAPSISLI